VNALMDALGRTAKIEPSAELPGAAELNATLSRLASAFDAEWGGFGGAPKFPSTMNLDLMLRAHLATGSRDAAVIVMTSLDAMASGGIYDHLGGGFARYSVDEKWLVPHFEKMLYDQALLVRAYTRAWQALGHDRWQQVVDETVGYVLRDLRHPDGGFYSAEDADSPDEHGHSHEGLFYVWTPAQIAAVVGEDVAPAVCEWYGVTERGNFEGANILNRMHARGQFERPPHIDRARNELFAARARRPRPGLDDKVLTEWNALFCASLAEAGAAFGRPDWIAAAVTNGEFLLDRLRVDGRWHRAWQADVGARHAAVASDLANLIDAFTQLAEATGQARWIDAARASADDLLDRFWDVDAGGVFTTPEDGEALIVRQKDVFDNATPSANSTAAVALYRLGALTGEQRYANHADRIIQLLGRVAAQSPGGFSNLLAAIDMRRVGLTEIAVVGDRPDMVRAIHARYLPNAVLAWGEPYDSPLWDQRREGLAYVCRQYTCQAPQDTLEGLMAQLDEPRPAAADA
jgi:uncharacterized protein YyaL (SSP411 family)